MGFSSVVEQVGLLGIVMLVGFSAVKTGYLSAGIKDGISKLIIKLLLPCLVISSISSKELSEELMGEMGLMLGMSLFCLLCMFSVSCLIAKLLRIPDGTAAVHKALSTMGNVIFVGQSIVVAMFGEGIFLYYIVYWLLNDLFFWTVGVFLFSRDNKRERKSLGSILCNPNTISFAIAVGMLLLKIRLPGMLQEATAGIGALTTYLSTLFIGMTLATVSLKNTLKKWWCLVLLPVKLVILPILFLLFFRALGLNEVLFGAVVLGTAMPSGMVITVAAKEQGVDSEYAAVGIFLTTVASLATLPLISYLLQIWT